MQLSVLSFAYDAHASVTQLLANAAVREALIDHWRESCVGETGVNESGGVGTDAK